MQGYNYVLTLVVKPQIFLSYSRGDQGPAHQLAKDLKDLGHAVWFDQDLTGGQAWWDQILARIRAADLFVFVLSSASLASIACQREYGYAAELERPIVPVLVGTGLSLNVLPPALSRVQFIDFRERHVEAILALARALHSLPVGVPLPDPLPAPPEVPISYLATLSQQIATLSTLSFEEQSRLVLELKTALRDPTTFQDARDLLGRLRVRRDLLATVAEEIDDVVVREPRRSRRGLADTSRALAGSLPFGERSPLSAVFSFKKFVATRGWRPHTHSPDLASLEFAQRSKVANQSVWLHWALWSLPFALLNFTWHAGLSNAYRLLTVTYLPISMVGLTSCVLTRSAMPAFGATGSCLLFLIISNVTVHSWDRRFSVYYLGSAIVGGLFSQLIIRRARLKLDAPVVAPPNL
jgi:hypothetical protein